MSDTGAPVDARQAALRSLDRLVGRWAVDGPSSSGTIWYEWMEGGAFLVQHIDLVSADGPTRGVEYVGWDPGSETLRSHYFAPSGEILEYTYDVTGATVTIWFGGTDSPAKFVGVFDDTGDRVTGGWQWPGGGYDSNMTRAEEVAP